MLKRKEAKVDYEAYFEVAILSQLDFLHISSLLTKITHLKWLK